MDSFHFAYFRIPSHTSHRVVIMDYKNLHKRFRTQKFSELSKDNEFIGLSPREKQWWIRYFKLKYLWKHTYPETEFPALIIDGPLNGRPRNTRTIKLCDEPWLDKNHSLNRKLDEVMEVFEEDDIKWERYQDYTTDVLFCNHDEGNGHTGCKNYDKCELR